MRIDLFGGLRVRDHGSEVVVAGTMQRALLARLAIDAGTGVSYRVLADDLWPDSAPENARAALQSIVSRLRSQLPSAVLESVPGGYRLGLDRGDVDVLAFQDLVSQAETDPGNAATLASSALALWTAEPWLPEGIGWYAHELLADRVRALDRGGRVDTRGSGSSLPTALSELIGREGDLELVRSQLQRDRLVTILGPGGAGKTRLAIEAARGRSNAILVELAPVAATEFWHAILATLGREMRSADGQAPSSTPRDKVIAGLWGRDVTLVLDNCEHLIEAAAQGAEELLSTLPRVTVLTTSREPLGILGESFVLLGPLPPEEAFELVDRRVQSARGRAVEAFESDAVQRMCDRLDGLPLALELAAAKARTHSLQEIADGLDDRFALLTGGSRTALPRHQTLRALVDWSWSLLGAPERVALSSLAIYPAGIAVNDAAIFGEAWGIDGRQELDSLVDKSLLRRVDGRYRALETIREYGIERLAQAGTLRDARAAQVRLLGERAAIEDRRLRGPEIRSALAWFDTEDDNLSAALRFGVASGDPEQTIALVARCLWYFTVRDRHADSRMWIESSMPIARTMDSEDAALVITIGIVTQAFTGANVPEKEPSVPPGLELIGNRAVGAGDNELLQIAVSLIRVFVASTAAGEWPIGMRIPADIGQGLDPWPTAVGHIIRAELAHNRGDIEEFGAVIELALHAFEELGDLWGLALSEQLHAEWLVLQGDLERAFEFTELSTEHLRDITSSWDLQNQQRLAVIILFRQGKRDEARKRIELLWAEAQDQSSSLAQFQAAATAASLAVDEGDIATGRRFLAEIERLSVDSPGLPRQLVSFRYFTSAGADILEGKLDSAEENLRTALEQALASTDNPVIAQVALVIGKLGVARGDLRLVADALQLSRAIRGIGDPTNPDEKLLVETLEKAALSTKKRSIPEVTDRSFATQELAQIFLR